jgi:type IV pilus assembly protein PilC
MATFSYKARSKTGEKVEGSVESQDRRSAMLQIERLGYVPVVVEESHAVATAKTEKGKGRFFSLGGHREPRMKTRDMLVFTTELSDLLSSGMQLGNALNTLSRRRVGPDTDAIVKSLRDQIVQGASLSTALGKFKETFSTLYINLINAGEASGNLSEVMQRIVKHFERSQETKEKVIMALVYPCIVLFVGIGTLIFSMVWVMPRFSVIFKDLGSTLPLPTRMLMGLSSFMIHYGLFVVAALFVLGGMFRKYIRSGAGRSWWHALHLKLPLIKDIIMANALTQFSRTLGMLIANGVPVLDALAIVERTIQNSVIASEIRKAREEVTDGTTISGPLAAGAIFPPLLTDMMAIGEETGDMTGALSHIARRYEAQLDRNLKIFTTVLEPVLIVLMAVIVGFVAISILLAVFDLTSGLNA